jgi:hypothetical protein
MKTAATILAVLLILIGVIGINQYFQRTEQLTQKEFAERDAYLNKRIDSLKTLLIEVKASQDTIRTDLDTLKKGQVIIYNEVKKVASKNFLDMFNF